MNTNCFTRPNKPLTCKRPDFNINLPIVDIDTPKLLTVDKSTECHTTPDHIAALMVEYLNYQKPTLNKAGSTILEPHAGTGQLVQALLNADIESWRINTIEKHNKLVDHMVDRFKGLSVNFNQGDFLTDYNNFKGAYDRIICNPPFKKIIKHIDQVYKCLNVGGLAICLVPTTYKKIDHEVLQNLDTNTFSNIQVSTKIIRITKQ